MRKTSTISNEERETIIAYAKATSPAEAQKKFEIWAETIKYWIDPSLREAIKKAQKTKWDIKMSDPVTREEYRKKANEKGAIFRTTQANKDYMREYGKQNFDRMSKITKQHRVDNLDHYKQKSKEHYLRDKVSGRLKEIRDRFHNKMKSNIREAVRRAIKLGQVDKTAPSIQYLGCEVDAFKIHIETQFKPGMTWDNHGRGEQCWHLDHIIPLATLNIGDIEQLKKLCHFTNYQPLWEKENLSKQDKYTP